MKHRYFSRNTAGNDYAVGDVHGSFRELDKKLEEIGFVPGKDRIFAAGDLVDKGKNSRGALAWLQKEGHYSVLGNHCSHVANHGKESNGNWLEGFGLWFKHLKPVFKEQLQVEFAKLPVAITVETEGGFVGIIHAGTPFDTWYETLANLTPETPKARANFFLYDRSNFNNRRNSKPIKDLRALIVGHSPLPVPELHANTWYLDTDAYKTGDFKILNLNTFEIL